MIESKNSVNKQFCRNIFIKMEKKFIPIIGTISAGKSTFLDGLLGIDSLQTGILTTTKFVCLIKNSQSLSFYHVIPKRSNSLILEKEGPEIKDRNEINERIKQINKEFNEKKPTSNDIFFMLETPIKNIKNQALLDNCYFMDIPGLNEHGASYIDNIFSVILNDDILFEIIVFDALSIGQQNIIDIFQNLEKKKVLKKEGNIYILNKIDRCTKGTNMVEVFQNFFYKEFEDEKKSPKIEINFSKNHFIPFNSILYQAETKYETDYFSMLLKELYIYLDSITNTSSESFYDCLEKRLECIVKQNGIDVDIFEDELSNLKKDEKENIKKAVSNIKELSIVETTQATSFDLNLNNKEVKETLYKLYIIQKKKLNNNYAFSSSYYELEDAINSYYTNLSSPPPATIGKSEDINKKKSLELLKELNNFINEQLKGQFNYLNRSLNVIIENLVERKIRLSFIGNISVGKSTVLNAIIGYDILPSKDDECTYRGVIIKHKNIPKFQLYRARMKIICEGTGTEYYKFEEVGPPYCEGISNIISHLNNKNKDINFNNEDTFIIIHGRLKIFDFIKLEDKFLKKLEFVDLPGHNRKENKFINRIGDDFSPYDKILRFTNSCIFLNQPNSIDDVDSVKRIQDEYSKNKEKLDKKLANRSLDTCIFLINKVDELSKENNEQEKKQIREKIFSILKEVEKNIPNNWNNISFFSGKCFKDYILYNYKYVELFENNPLYLLKILYKEWINLWLYPKNLKHYILKTIGAVQEKLELLSKNNDDSDDENENIKVPENINKTMKSTFNEFRKISKYKITPKEENEITTKLYELYSQIKTKNFDNTKYSQLFFRKIKEVVMTSDNIQSEILKLEMENFFNNADQLFKRNIENEKAAKQNEKDKIKEQYDLFKDKIIPEIKNYLDRKQNDIKKIIINTREKCLGIIKDEIDNAGQRLKDADNDLEKASNTLEEKIKTEYNEMIRLQEKEVKNILDDIIKKSNKAIETHYSKSSLSESEIGIMKGKAIGIVTTLLTGALGGIATGVGLAAIGSSVLAGIAAGTISATAMTTLVGSFFGPLGVVAGVGVGGLITGIGFIIRKLTKKSKYIKALEDTKTNIEQKFDDIESNFIKNFASFKNTLVNELIVKNEVYLKGIDNIPIPDWNKMIDEYNKRKKDIKNKLNEEINNF